MMPYFPHALFDVGLTHSSQQFDASMNNNDVKLGLNKSPNQNKPGAVEMTKMLI